MPRLRKDLRVELPDGWIGEVIDVSALGMRVCTGGLLPVGAKFEGTVQWTDGPSFKIGARVVWVKPRPHGLVQLDMGLEVFEAPPDYLQALAELFADKPA